MGYSPGGFKCKKRGNLHWELRKDHILLWCDGEMDMVLDIYIDEAIIACAQLDLLTKMGCPDLLDEEISSG